MASQTEHLHFLLIPLMSQSHIIPLTDFAKLLARQGPVVSIITTPRNVTRFRALADYATRENLRIHSIPIPFPGQQFGLPEGCENLDSLPSSNLSRTFFDACSMMQEPIENLAKQLKPKPSCIISSNALLWTQNLAQKLGIPRYVFQTVSSFTLVCAGRIGKILSSHNPSDSDTFLLPGLPHKIEFRKSQLPDRSNRKESDDYRKEVQDLARGTLVNSFEEMEQWYVEEQKKLNKNYWEVGPVSLMNNTVSGTAKDDYHYSLKWLDSAKPNSVIYACFGSLCHLSFTQLREIGLGLEASGHPFIWVIRELDYTPEVEKWLKDENFEERVKGLVVRGWAPQVPILSHSSVGEFLTHCGWNSTLEGVCAGVPMLCWPMFAEQFFNEKFVVDVLRVGVRIGVETNMKSGEENKVLIKREQIKAAIDQLMDEGEEREERRKTASKLSEMATNAIQEGGSSYRNIILLVQDVFQLQHASEKINATKTEKL